MTERAFQRTLSPLSWADARYRLRETLTAYLSSPVVPSLGFNRKHAVTEENTNPFSSRISTWILSIDLDLWLSAFLSFSLLIITILMYLSASGFVSLRWLRGEDHRFPSLPPAVSIAEIAAAGVLFSGSILGILIVRQRRYLIVHDSEQAKQREIRKFLSQSEQEHDENIHEHLNHHTSITDVFPVFRLASGGSARWSKLPSLLLVHGDWVALQVGDITPAPVTLFGPDSDGVVHIPAGVELTKEHIANVFISDPLPSGRTTLPPGSKHLLELSNCLRIFRVRETPLDSFLKRPTTSCRPSRLARQVDNVRVFMTLLAVILLLSSGAVVLIRRAGALAHVPFLVSLGVLPVFGPLICFFLEIVGTSRILSAVHPYSIPLDDNLQNQTAGEFSTYFLATLTARMTLWKLHDKLFSKRVRVPPASIPLLECLGVATAFTLVDDELACEPHSIPQQLLIPSRKGLKLLDLCPVGDSFEESDDERSQACSDSETSWRKARGKSFDSDDSDDSDTLLATNNNLSLRNLPRRLRRRRLLSHDTSLDGMKESSEILKVQFEEPNWWQFLPSLKGIGLACLLNEEAKQTGVDGPSNEPRVINHSSAQDALVRMVCHERYSRQLKLLAECIGFSSEPNTVGERGDISTFKECLRLQLMSGSLYRQRLQQDAHERGTEQTRWWGLLRPDSTSVIVEDSRTKAYQLLTVGDPSIVTQLCNEAWQGEISTVLPLAPVDRQAIVETARDWKLGDLDVAAFSYTPVPYTLENRLCNDPQSHFYLLDNSDDTVPFMKDKALPEEWTFVKNQVFLGVLGSLVVPRKETQRLLRVLNVAGVRFVYFSPRNMRRQKELAAQMGIDVAWNCAISLRPLEHGCELDPYRMVSQYADWDVNAKLPHGVAAVRTHLLKVDNVPLLVSLFTDATKQTTKEMVCTLPCYFVSYSTLFFQVEVFQEHSDTVVSLGISHLPRNQGIFSSSDISIGIDVLRSSETSSASLGPDLEFVSAISAHGCAFRLRGMVPAPQMASILSTSRASQEAVTAAGVLFACGSVSYSIYAFLSLLSPLYVMPSISSADAAAIHSVIFLLAVSLAMTGGDAEIMKRVPMKNETACAFNKNEGSTFFSMLILKAILPAALPQLLHLVVVGSAVVRGGEACPLASNWMQTVRCRWETSDHGPIWRQSGLLVAIAFLTNLTITSAGFAHRFHSINSSRPWLRNSTWLFVAVLVVLLLTATVVVIVGADLLRSIPWYGFLTAGLSPGLSLFAVEYLKRTESKQEERSEKFRRLKFETRLGQWSPR